MDCKVKYKHFTPDHEEHQKCSDLMGLIDDLSPSDSTVQAIIDRVSDGTYKTIISVKGFCGAFDSESSGLSLLSSLKKAHRGVLDNLSAWKRQRFVEV